MWKVFQYFVINKFKIHSKFFDLKMPFAQIEYKDIYFDPKVQEMCISPSFKCPFYGHSWSCPPNSPYLQKALETYTDFYLIYSMFDLESYVREEIERTNRSEFYIKNTFLLTKSFDSNDLEIEFEKFLSQYDKKYKKRILLYDGTCKYCKIMNVGSCTFDSGSPCRFPQEKRFSMEATGIEVISTVQKLKNKLGIEYPSNKYSYRFGLACFK
jgi:predicted metal-binding protein